ncbi:MAG: hypothetical protein Q9169_004141 [Polycauliona sp. 2 TL-2023]
MPISLQLPLSLPLTLPIHILRELLSPQRPRILRTPSPDALSTVVTAFLTNFFVFSFDCSHIAALALARRYTGDADGVYGMTVKELDELFVVRDRGTVEDSGRERVQDSGRGRVQGRPDGRCVGREMWMWLHLGRWGKFRNAWFYTPLLTLLITILSILLTFKQINDFYHLRLPAPYSSSASSHHPETNIFLPGAGLVFAFVLNALLYGAYRYCRRARTVRNRTFPRNLVARRWCWRRVNGWGYLLAMGVCLGLVPVLVVVVVGGWRG